MYFSTIFSNSASTTGAITIFMSPGNGSVRSPSILSMRWVDFFLSVIFQLPDTSALPSPLTGVQTTLPLALFDVYLDA